MTNPETWKRCFALWPEALARRGVIVTSLDEQIPFVNFSLGENLILLDRHAPDTMGTRQVILPYEHIVSLKITDVVKQRELMKLGFVPASVRHDKHD